MFENKPLNPPNPIGMKLSSHGKAAEIHMQPLEIPM
jgi:hypothetical protein